jgi:hypothetical protein
MDDEDEGVITAGALVTLEVELIRKTLKVCSLISIYERLNFVVQPHPA